MSTTDDVRCTDLQMPCTDGYLIRGHHWSRAATPRIATVIINPATGVLARYYHPLAKFLARHGFDVLTYDYRGIGASRPAALRGSGIRWRDWGELDFDAVVRFARETAPDARIRVIGHSIGGFLPGLADATSSVERILTVGAQYAYYRDYARVRRASLMFKWHLVMPVLTRVYGYFPGRRLGWLEDLPAGVANEWSFRRADVEAGYPMHLRHAVLERFAAIRAPITAIATLDDDYATFDAMHRTIRYFRSSDRTIAILDPASLGHVTIGHFGLFHSRHEHDAWQGLLQWLRTGEHPWPEAIVMHAAAERMT